MPPRVYSWDSLVDSDANARCNMIHALISLSRCPMHLPNELELVSKVGRSSVFAVFTLKGWKVLTKVFFHNLSQTHHFFSISSEGCYWWPDFHMIDMIIYKLRSFRIHSQVDSHMDPLHPTKAQWSQGWMERHALDVLAGGSDRWSWR